MGISVVRSRGTTSGTVCAAILHVPICNVCLTLNIQDVRNVRDAAAISIWCSYKYSTITLLLCRNMIGLHYLELSWAEPEPVLVRARTFALHIEQVSLLSSEPIGNSNINGETSKKKATSEDAYHWFEWCYTACLSWGATAIPSKQNWSAGLLWSPLWPNELAQDVAMGIISWTCYVTDVPWEIYWLSYRSGPAVSVVMGLFVFVCERHATKILYSCGPDTLLMENDRCPLGSSLPCVRFLFHRFVFFSSVCLLAWVCVYRLLVGWLAGCVSTILPGL